MIELQQPARRIVSLVPSQTELLFDLGLTNEVVGVTQFCTHPPERVANTTRVGGTKRFLFERIDALAPDLILGNKEENYVEGIERLRTRHAVWMSDIHTLDDALDMISQVGRLVGREAAASGMYDEIRSAFRSLSVATRRRAAYFIWRKPWMVVGGDNFIHDMLVRAGFDNVFGDAPRYPRATDDELRAADPDVVLLSSEPFPFTAEHVDEVQRLLPRADVHLVDGTLLSWYGSRLRHTPAYLGELAARVAA